MQAAGHAAVAAPAILVVCGSKQIAAKVVAGCSSSFVSQWMQQQVCALAADAAACSSLCCGIMLLLPPAVGSPVQASPVDADSKKMLLE